MSDLESLIEKLAALSGPDRVMDGEIWKAVTEKPGDVWTNWFDDGVWHRRDPDDRCAFEGPPRLTESIDAALSLLLPHHSFELTQSAVEPPAFSRARIWDWRRGPLAIDPGNEWKSEGNRPLAINLCIAALRARAQAEEALQS